MKFEESYRHDIAKYARISRIDLEQLLLPYLAKGESVGAFWRQSDDLMVEIKKAHGKSGK